MDSRQNHVLTALVGLLWYDITLISATCQPPAAGYTLQTSVNKYYKSVRDSVTWQAARDACSSEGTILVELRTADEYQAIRPIFGKIMSKFKFIPHNIFSLLRTCIKW